MKTYITVLGLALSAVAFSATAQAPSNVIGPGINHPMYALQATPDAAWPKELVGTWQGAEDLSRGIPAGKIVLTGSKQVSIEPEGMYVLKGYWFARPGGKLVFDTPVDKSEASYELKDKGKTLSLTFSNGMTQVLQRAPQVVDKKVDKK
jgi:hypothetical protein